MTANEIDKSDKSDKDDESLFNVVHLASEIEKSNFLGKFIYLLSILFKKDVYICLKKKLILISFLFIANKMAMEVLLSKL